MLIFRSIKKNDELGKGLAIDRYSHLEQNVEENTQKAKENKDSHHEKNPSLQSPPPTKIPIGELQSSEAPESPESCNLTVKVVKDRGRRRKRRAGGGALASKFEVSSSQSGNSTPSSPRSPTVSTPNSSFSSFGAVSEEPNHEKQREFSLSNEQPVLKSSGDSGRPVLLSSASFPSSARRAPGVSTSNLFASSSPIAPYARAPGSKLSKELRMQTEEDEAFGKQYTYDIWGNHFCGHLMGKPKELLSKVSDASEGDSHSFFTRDPQSLMMMPSAHSETSGHKLTPSDVDYLHRIK